MRFPLLLAACCLVGASSHAEGLGADARPAATEAWAVHGQVTNVTQWHPTFRSPYSGANSLVADGRSEETTDLTLYAGLRPWHGAELWINPEIDQGFGLSNTVGVAGYPSGEAYKVGADRPYVRLPRLFLRQTISLDGEPVAVEAAANQLASVRGADNVVLTVGKFSVVDIFDTNTYAHDPRTDFLNWSVIDSGPFDYAADPWGFTHGAAAEVSQGAWSWRGGVFQLSPVPNGKITAVGFTQTMWVFEGERRLSWQGHPGKLKLLTFVNRGRMARYADAVQRAEGSGDVPDVSLVRRRASRAGVTLNVEQEVAGELGAFARAGINDGRKEAYEFTEINRSLSAGLVLKGGRWGRADDTLGLAGAVNGLSQAARAYFGAGGIGILIGDGRLNYGAEQIVEATYSFRWDARLALSADYQRINHPAYNRDRGPVSIYSIRAHAEF
jgi:high affinity Mn2+ porin